ncbi:hypothetical protein [Fulvivirga sedimenti]|uniref:Uncharacterized protein n=1 Tax=Fulvivirga sedimenti TaxID=2879465 RepID=A0A9X1HLX6_9BACT|nr:hypothetical protein [Fulvivirga sedimenti]MCA6073766.1 hypothetical protein [Fulvivirga sedimenti]
MDDRMYYHDSPGGTRKIIVNAIQRITFFALLIPVLLIASCSDEEISPEPLIVTDFLPLIEGNQWTYRVEGISENGEVTSNYVERWRVNEQSFIEIYRVTNSEEEYTGYKAIFPYNDQEIRDMIGTYISLAHLSVTSDSLVPVASDNINILRQRWIRGGLITLSTSFGKRDCICVKTAYYFSPVDNWQEQYDYFCKGIGIYLREKKYYTIDEFGNVYSWFTWKRTMTSNQLSG